MESVGRTDLPTGNGQRIVESVQSLMSLPADTIVFTGHGEATTIKYESANNPFLHGWE
jgi:glyoxylase-like metal-dependent hydrolase (beta-lactamase superfamily II)